MAETVRRKQVPMQIGEHQFTFKELRIEDLDKIDSELKRWFLKNCELQLSIIDPPPSDVELRAARREFLRSAASVSMHSADGASLISSVEGMILLCWAAVETKMTFPEFRKLVHAAKPSEVHLVAFAHQAKDAFEATTPIPRPARGDNPGDEVNP